MIIPRENDLVRLYIQLTNEEIELDRDSGRADRKKMTPEKLLEVARKSFSPYTIETHEKVDWWTIYTSNLSLFLERCRF